MNRRGFLSGLVATLAAPAVIRTPGLLMPVKTIVRAEAGWSVRIITQNDWIVWKGAWDEAVGGTRLSGDEISRFLFWEAA